MSEQKQTEKTQDVLWDFHVRAVRRTDGYYRVTITGAQTSLSRERAGYHPLWELIRLLAPPEKTEEIR